MGEVLADEERQKFVVWLERDAMDSQELALRAEKIGHYELATRLRAEALACWVVARKLRSTESQIVDKG